VPHDAVLDLGIEFAELAPYLKVAAGQDMVVLCNPNKVFKCLDDVGVSQRILFGEILSVDLPVDPVPAYPFAVVVNAWVSSIEGQSSPCRLSHILTLECCRRSRPDHTKGELPHQGGISRPGFIHTTTKENA
jgi:hypothetical protein